MSVRVCAYVCAHVCLFVHACIPVRESRALSNHFVEGSSAQDKVSRDHLSEVGVLALLP